MIFFRNNLEETTLGNDETKGIKEDENQTTSSNKTDIITKVSKETDNSTNGTNKTDNITNVTSKTDNITNGTNGTMQNATTEEKKNHSKNEETDKNQSISIKNDSRKPDNETRLTEELYFLNASDLVVKEEDLGPPLEDSEMKLLPKEEAEYLTQRQKMFDDGMDSAIHQRLIPIFRKGKLRKGQRNRAALTNPNSMWGNCQVPYTISNGYSKQDRAVIKSAMTQFAKETGINWVPKQSGNKDFVNIQPGTGCSSRVGKTGGAQPLTLGEMEFNKLGIEASAILDAHKLKIQGRGGSSSSCQNP